MRLTPVSLLLCLASVSLGAVVQSPAAVAYSPTLQTCPPGTSLVRQVGSNPKKQSLNADEAQYVSARRSRVTPDAWRKYLLSVQVHTGVALPFYVDGLLLGLWGKNALPNLGIATSGGGYRAAIFGAGVLNALDGRNKTSIDAGTGGLLQAATYLSGLSGGSWLVSSLAQADFPMLPELVFGPPSTPSGNAFGGWLTEIDILQVGGSNATATAAFVGELLQEVALKFGKGFPVTVTDLWARALARHFANGTTAGDLLDPSLTHGAGLTFSSIANGCVMFFLPHASTEAARI